MTAIAIESLTGMVLAVESLLPKIDSCLKMQAESPIQVELAPDGKLSVIRERTKSKRIQLLDTYFEALGVSPAVREAFLSRLNLKAVNALYKVIELFSVKGVPNYSGAASILEKAELWEAAAFVYRLDLRFFASALHYQSRGLKSHADSIIEEAGYKGLSEAQAKQVDAIGQEAKFGLEAAIGKLSALDIPEGNKRRIVEVWKQKLDKGLGDLRKDVPLNIGTLSVAEISKVLGIQFLSTSISVNQAFAALKKGVVRENEELFFMSANSRAFEGRAIQSSYGGAFADGKGLVIRFSSRVLDAFAFHATPNWNTQGKRTEKSVEGTDKAGMAEFFKDIVRNEVEKGWSTTEIVFDGKENARLFQSIEEIWIHPYHRRGFLAKLKEEGLVPPRGKTWEEIVKGFTHYPE